MKRFSLFLVIVGALSFVGTAPAAAQMIGAPPAVDAPQAKNADDFHEKMCDRMCGQHGKKKQVCSKSGKTYPSACVAKCAKVSYKSGPCPTPAKSEGEQVAKADATEPTDLGFVDKRLVGQVKWFNAEKKYGFISSVGGAEVYLEQAAINDKRAPAPKEGDRVRFEAKPGPQGVHAANVSVVTEEEEKAAAERRKQAALGMLEEEPTPTPRPKVEAPKQAAPDDGIYVIPSR